MQYLTLVLMALALSMDALAVAVARGMASRHRRLDAVATALAFGAAQAAMPMLGFWGGQRLAGEALRTGGTLVAALVLALLGGKMLIEARDDEPPLRSGGGYLGGLLAQAAATSIDALAVGIGLYGMENGILLPAAVIGVVTAAVCWGGFMLGAVLGGRDCRRAQLLGGVILLLLALHALVG